MKPIYKYIELWNTPIVGHVVYLLLSRETPHPNVSGDMHIRTSGVVRLFDDGEGFETLNSIYMPAGREERLSEIYAEAENN